MPFSTKYRGIAGTIYLAFLTIGVNFTISPRAYAQTKPASTVLVMRDSTISQAQEDTVLAIRRLFFEQRRKGRRNIIIQGIGVAAFSALLLVQDAPQTTTQWIQRSFEAGYLGYSSYKFIHGIILSRRYRVSREQQLIRIVELGNPLPDKVRKKLRPNYFATTPEK